VDPPELARGLIEDWSSVRDDYKRRELEKLIERIIVRTGHESARITIVTTWGHTISYTAGSAHAFACHYQPGEERWFTAAEAATKAGVGLSTIRDWRKYVCSRTADQSAITICMRNRTLTASEQPGDATTWISIESSY
jgi:hypothetical protein